MNSQRLIQACTLTRYTLSLRSSSWGNRSPTWCTSSSYLQAWCSLLEYKVLHLPLLSCWLQLWAFRKGWSGGNLRNTKSGSFLLRMPTTGVPPATYSGSWYGTLGQPPLISKSTFEHVVRSIPSLVADSSVEAGKRISAVDCIWSRWLTFSCRHFRCRSGRRLIPG